MDTIVVNAIGATSGGGESILRQCLNAVASEERARCFKWVFFVSKELDVRLEGNHIRLERIETRSLFDKMLWYLFLLNNHVKESGLSPKVFVNLMNYGVRGIKIPQIIYVHQPLPFGDFREFKIFELKARFYTWGIGKWMKWSIKRDSTIVVQTNWMKEAVTKKLRISSDQVHVIRPVIDPLTAGQIQCVSHKNFRLFYPAVPVVSYKNHELLIKMLSVMKSTTPQLYSKIKLSFTCKPDDRKLTRYYYRLSKRLSVDEKIEWKGYLSKDELLKEYCASDVVLFPSKLETFGLPLEEAASLGKPVIVLDKAYAHDVIETYEGALYLGNDPERWSRAIENFYSSGGFSAGAYSAQSNNGWKGFLKLIADRASSKASSR